MRGNTTYFPGEKLVLLAMRFATICNRLLADAVGLGFRAIGWLQGASVIGEISG
jgi:hypothetical protein